jgi:hypothetical protein
MKRLIKIPFKDTSVYWDSLTYVVYYKANKVAYVHLQNVKHRDPVLYQEIRDCVATFIEAKNRSEGK